MATRRTGMGLTLATVTLAAVVVAPATGQIVCSPQGPHTYCFGDNGSSSIQSQLAPNRGVIITDHATTPYTILSPKPSETPKLIVPTPGPSDGQFRTPSYLTPQVPEGGNFGELSTPLLILGQ